MDSFDLDMCNRIGLGGNVTEKGGAATDVHRIKALAFGGNCIIRSHLVLLRTSFGEFHNYPLKNTKMASLGSWVSVQFTKEI